MWMRRWWSTLSGHKQAGVEGQDSLDDFSNLNGLFCVRKVVFPWFFTLSHSQTRLVLRLGINFTETWKYFKQRQLVTPVSLVCFMELTNTTPAWQYSGIILTRVLGAYKTFQRCFKSNYVWIYDWTSVTAKTRLETLRSRWTTFSLVMRSGLSITFLLSF